VPTARVRAACRVPSAECRDLTRRCWSSYRVAARERSSAEVLELVSTASNWPSIVLSSWSVAGQTERRPARVRQTRSR